MPKTCAGSRADAVGAACADLDHAGRADPDCAGTADVGQG